MGKGRGIDNEFRRHVTTVARAYVLNVVIWFSLSADQLQGLSGAEITRHILTDLLETLVATVIIAEISLFYGRALTRLFWRGCYTCSSLMLFVLILAVSNFFTALFAAYLYSLLYPNDPTLYRGVIITDSLVIAAVTSISVVSFLVSEHKKGEIVLREVQVKSEREKVAAMQSQMDVLALQSDNHFIFNGLGPFAGLIHENLDEAEKFVINVFRYLTTSVGKRVVPLKDELGFLGNYTSMLRYCHDGVSVEVDPELGKLDYVVPLVSVQLLVENTVKHNGRGKDDELKIKVELEGGTDGARNLIVVENNILPLDGEESSTGTGLKNLNDRYQIISGENIIVDNDGRTFRVEMPVLRWEDIKDEGTDN